MHYPVEVVDVLLEVVHGAIRCARAAFECAAFAVGERSRERFRVGVGLTLKCAPPANVQVKEKEIIAFWCLLYCETKKKKRFIHTVAVCRKGRCTR